MEKIIVTGGLGYIGAHTVVSLIEKNYEVIIIDNLVNAQTATLKRIQAITNVLPQFYEINLCDTQKVTDFFEAHSDASAVIHFAALKAVKESVEQPIAYYKNNLFGLINMIAAMEKYQIENLVFSSSATVYGVPDALPLTEKSPTKPALSPYGNTKKIGEDIIKDTTIANSNFNAVALRYFNPIGAHPSGQIGELPNGVPNNLMPFITQTAVGIRKELMVFGDDYDTPDGTAIRDYIHVVDLAVAHLKTVERLLKKEQQSSFEIFNLGTGKGSSVLEVIQSFEKASGKKLPYKIVARRAGDVEAMYASTDLANQELDWKAKHNLDEMTASSWYYERQIRNLE